MKRAIEEGKNGEKCSQKGKRGREERGEGEGERGRVGGKERGGAYFEMVIFVPDSAMMRLRVLPPFPVE